MSIERAILRAHATRRDNGVRDVSFLRQRDDSVGAHLPEPALPAFTPSVRRCRLP
jgi:hypothetical protein